MKIQQSPLDQYRSIEAHTHPDDVSGIAKVVDVTLHVGFNNPKLIDSAELSLLLHSGSIGYKRMTQEQLDWYVQVFNANSYASLIGKQLYLDADTQETSIDYYA